MLTAILVLICVAAIYAFVNIFPEVMHNKHGMGLVFGSLMILLLVVACDPGPGPINKTPTGEKYGIITIEGNRYIVWYGPDANRMFAPIVEHICPTCATKLVCPKCVTKEKSE